MSKVKLFPIAAKVTIVFVISFVVLIGGCNWKMDSDLATAKANARKAGLPITSQELRELLPKPSESENAAAVFEKALTMEIGRSPEEIEARKLSFKKDLKTAEVNRLISLKPKLDRISNLAAALDGKTAVDFKRQWEQGIFLKFPEYAKAKGMVQMLAVSARLKASTGDRIGALKDIQRGFKAGEMIGTEPTIIAMLVMIACESIAVTSLNFVIGDKPLSREELKIVAEMREILGTPRPMSYWLLSEPPMTVNTLEAIDSRDLLDPKLYQSPDRFSNIILSSPFRKTSLADYLETITKQYKVTSNNTLSPKLLMSRCKELDKEADQSDMFAFRKLVSAMFLPVLSQASEAKIKQYVIRVLIDKLLGKRKEVDSFTEQPLKKKIFPSGTLYYSVGPNLKDDGGLIYDKIGKRITGKDDISIFVPKNR